MAISGFSQVLQSMAQADFFTGVLPFVVTYVLFFMVLKQLPLIKGMDGNDPEKFAAIISVVFAFFVARFVTLNPLYSQFFVEYMGRLTVALVGVLGLLVVLGFVGLDLKKDETAANIIGLLLFLMAGSAFFVSGGVNSFFPAASQQGLASIVNATLVWLFNTGAIWVIMIGGLLYWATKPSGSSSDSVPRFFKALFDGSSEEENPS